MLVYLVFFKCASEKVDAYNQVALNILKSFPVTQLTIVLKLFLKNQCLISSSPISSAQYLLVSD